MPEGAHASPEHAEASCQKSMETSASTDWNETTLQDCDLASLANNTVCMSTPEEMLKPWKINAMFFDIVIMYAVTCLFGVAGNVIVILVMTHKRSRNATNLFLGSLAVADLLLLLVYAPLDALQYFVMQWDRLGGICKVAKFAEFLSAVASVLNLAAVTLERFIVIVFPIQSRSLCTLTNCRRGIAVVWTSSLLLAVPVVFSKITYPLHFTNNVTTVTLYYCNDGDYGTAFAIYQLVVLFGAPGILMLVCYTHVIMELWRSTRNIRILTNEPTKGRWRESDAEDIELTDRHVVTDNNVPYKGSEIRKARQQVIKMLITVIVLFVVCWGSRLIMELMMKIGLSTYSPAIYRLRVALFVLPMIHSCMNPVIYSFMSKNFRRCFKEQMVFCKRLNKKERRARQTRHRNERFSSDRRHLRTHMSTSSTNYVTDNTKLTEVELNNAT